MKRIKTSQRGVYFYERSKRHNGRLDRRFVLRYRWNGRQYEESAGWASEGMNLEKATGLWSQLRDNQRTGQGPCTMAEMREQAEAQKEAERIAKEAEKKQEISFKTFFEKTFLPAAKTRWKPATTDKAVSHVNVWIHPVTGNTPLRELGLMHANRIKAALSEAKKSPRLQQYVFRTFAMVWNAALDHGLVGGPCPTKSQSFRLPKVDNEKQRYLTIDEEKKLLAEVLKKSKQAHDMAIVSLDAGLRFGEVAGLTWGVVDTEAGSLRVLDTKSGRDRNVPMTERLKSLFESLETGKPADLVFPATMEGGVQKQVPSAFKRGLKDAKLNEGIDNPKLRASFHTLRHTCASRLVQAGVDLYRVQRILGHSTPVMTARYSKLADADLRQAVQAMEQNSKTVKGKVIPLKRSGT